ncbi:hypothetical protein [Motiliproteus sp.]|uniref:hypothetical protein n=1 Tax=Motiliproteus sp. TaxID=1898955 RepID=UPI003BAA8E16
MSWLVITLIFLAIIGSMMWMKPSPRQRMQADLRQQAMRLGFQVQISRLTLPRALGEAFGEERNCVAYRLPRLARQQAKPPEWQIFRLESHANVGLPQGWSWAKGEGYQSEAELARITALIIALPETVYGIESTPVSVSIYWDEFGTPETIEQLKQQLEPLLTSSC